MKHFGINYSEIIPVLNAKKVVLYLKKVTGQEFTFFKKRLVYREKKRLTGNSLSAVRLSTGKKKVEKQGSN